MSKTATLSRPSGITSTLLSLIDRSGKSVAKAQRTTVSQRKAKLLEDLEGFDVDRLIDIKDQMSTFVDLITMSLGEGAVLTESQAYTLMQQALGRRDISEFLDVCNARIKEVVFGHLNATFEEEGEEDPENINGSIEVPSLGMKFCREGAGHADPSINEGLLKLALGDRWKEVYEEQVIPEKRVYSLNMDKLWEMVEDDPSLMETIRDSLDPGAAKNARLVLRTIS